MKNQLRLQINTQARGIAIILERNTDKIVLTAEGAIELAGKLLSCCKEIQNADDSKRMMDSIIKEISH